MKGVHCWQEVKKLNNKMIPRLMVALALASLVSAGFSVSLGTAQEQHAITVKAEDDAANLLAVDVGWANATHSGISTTTFTLTGQSGDLDLDAPATYTPDGSVFYIFAQWIVDGTTYNTPSITISITTDLEATAQYAKTLSISKTLANDAGVPTPHDANSQYVDPSNVPLNTVVYFDMEIKVHFYTTATDVKVTDGIGADLVLDSYAPSFGDVVVGPPGKSKGKMHATKVVWTIGEPVVCEDCTLDLVVYTGLNPQNKQEYTSYGDHYLNSGPEVCFTYNGIQYDFTGNPVMVTAPEPAVQ